jgi:hypothetical protein
MDQNSWGRAIAAKWGREVMPDGSECNTVHSRQDRNKLRGFSEFESRNMHRFWEVKYSTYT